MKKLVALIFVITLCAACTSNTRRNQQAPNLIACYKLKSLTQPKGAPQPNSWLYDRPEELHQSLKEYIASQPLRANTRQQKLYLVKLGDFDHQAQRIFKDVQAYLSAYFQIETDTIASCILDLIPETDKRTQEGKLQVQTGYILNQLLPPLKPQDALALIAFCTEDLYPDENWNFVFGQANLHQGLGVWSIVRLGDRDNEVSFAQVRLRALSTASHETGHMLSLLHCVNNECNMNGSNSLEESDAQVEWLCWECLAKVCYNRNIYPKSQLNDLLAFHKRIGSDTAIQNYYLRALSLLDSSQSKTSLSLQLK